MKKGDIVLVSFPFTNLAGKKRRPAVILYKGKTDVIVAFITSKLKWEESTDLLLMPDIFSNNLKIASLVRASKIATLEKGLIAGKIGELKLEEIQELDENLKKIFKLF
jgi:mRNA interferase MazF